MSHRPGSCSGRRLPGGRGGGPRDLGCLSRAAVLPVARSAPLGSRRSVDAHRVSSSSVARRGVFPVSDGLHSPLHRNHAVARWASCSASNTRAPLVGSVVAGCPVPHAPRRGGHRRGNVPSVQVAPARSVASHAVPRPSPRWNSDRLPGRSRVVDPVPARESAPASVAPKSHRSRGARKGHRRPSTLARAERARFHREGGSFSVRGPTCSPSAAPGGGGQLPTQTAKLPWGDPAGIPSGVVTVGRGEVALFSSAPSASSTRLEASGVASPKVCPR